MSSEHLVRRRSYGGPLAAWPQAGDAGGGGEGDAAQAQVEAVDLGGHRDLGEEGPVAGELREAVAVLNVLDDVQDLLPLRLPRHPADVEDGRYVLLPYVWELSHQDSHFHLDGGRVLQEDDLRQVWDGAVQPRGR